MPKREPDPTPAGEQPGESPIQSKDGIATGSPFPPGTRCLECHYSLDGLKMGRCPECGFEMGKAEVLRLQERIHWMDSFRLNRWYAVCFLVPIVYAIGVFVLSDIGAGIASLVMMSITVGGTILTSEILGSLGKRNDRAIVRQVWMRSAYLIHLPWLVVAGFATILLVIAWIDKSNGSGRVLASVIAMFGLFLWIAGSLLSVIGLCVALSESNPRFALRWSKLQITIITLVITFQFIYNVILGISGGALAFSGVMRLAGLSP